MEGQSQKHPPVGQTCPTCERHFDRVEHLRRHLATHTKERNCVCRVCGRKFSRIDALNRHQSVHRPHVPLRRFRACTQCAASRVKCSGAPPCVRCEKKSLACMFPEGTEHVDRTSVGAGEPGEDAQGTNPRSDEMQPMMIAAQQEQQHEQEPQSVPTLEPRTAAYVFMQQQTQPVDLISQQMDTHMISTLNWISPTMDFDLATGFDYNPMASNGQYWESPTDIQNVPNQAPPPTTQTMSLIDHLPHSTPGSFPDSSDAERPGTAYVDSKGFRQPRAGRYASRIFGEETSRESPRRDSEFPRMTPELDTFSFAMPPVPNFPPEETDAIQVQHFSLEQYRILSQAFRDYCLTPNDIFQDGPFLSSDLPSMSTFTTLIALYRRHLDPKVLPMIHPQLHKENMSSWIVKLAMSAIGSQYLGTLHSELAVVLHEFLRRVLRPRGAVFSNRTLTIESLGLVQAKVLNYIGLAYCGSKRLDIYRQSTLQDLVGEYMLLHRTHPTVLRGEIAFEDGQDWMLAESARRLCHAIWFIETMSRCHFDTQSTLLLDYAEIALPCREDIWQVDPDQMQTPIDQPTLEKGLRILYVEKRLLNGVGDFAQVLIIHGLFCQTWDIAKSLSKPLLRWTPSAQKGSAESHELTSLSWLPQIPLYNHWRNAACDCLDVLHWIANSDVAKAGTENSTVLHLHFARLVLLTPYQTIRETAELLVSEGSTHGDSAEKLQKYCQEIQKWIIDDQFKARLALVHCGVLFWHVRRYSTDAFYEPTKVFLATLVVWAYGSLCPPQQSTLSSRGSNNDRSRDDGEWSSDLDDIPSSIRLDRPTDDELVQIFIKRGRSMSATIMGVGNITATNGPSRMLREGCKLLNTLDKWPIRRQYSQTLTRLTDICGRDRRWLQTVLNMSQTRQAASSL